MEALKIRRESNAKKGAERKDLSSLLWKIADVNRERQNFEDARKLARAAYELDKARVAKGGTSDQANFGRDCGRLGYLAMLSGDYKDAASRFTMGTGILKTLDQKHRLMGSDRQQWLQVQLRQGAVVAAINASKNLDAALDTLKAADQAAELLILRAVLAARDGKHANAHQFAQKILRRDPTTNARSHYDVAPADAACVHAVRKGRLLSELKVEELAAVQGYVDEAVQSLQYAIHQDAAYLPRMLNNDELDIVRDDAKYRELIDQLKKVPALPAVTASAGAGAKRALERQSRATQRTATPVSAGRRLDKKPIGRRVRPCSTRSASASPNTVGELEAVTRQPGGKSDLRKFRVLVDDKMPVRAQRVKTRRKMDRLRT